VDRNPIAKSRMKKKKDNIDLGMYTQKSDPGKKKPEEKKQRKQKKGQQLNKINRVFII
jgi:hypothetical protein